VCVCVCAWCLHAVSSLVCLDGCVRVCMCVRMYVAHSKLIVAPFMAMLMTLLGQ
jgi:hypothetical protein